MVRALIRAVDGVRINLRGFYDVPRGSWLARNAKGALALSGCGGFRLAEVALIDGTAFTAMTISRASLFFIINGTTKRCPTLEELRSMRSGVGRVGVLACAAKNDPLVIHFLPSPVIVSFNAALPDQDEAEEARVAGTWRPASSPCARSDLETTPC
jgi:hypothetical protein